jgi:hypothetical protein
VHSVVVVEVAAIDAGSFEAHHTVTVGAQDDLALAVDRDRLDDALGQALGFPPCPRTRSGRRDTRARCR